MNRDKAFSQKPMPKYGATNVAERFIQECNSNQRSPVRTKFNANTEAKNNDDSTLLQDDVFDDRSGEIGSKSEQRLSHRIKLAAPLSRHNDN